MTSSYVTNISLSQSFSNGMAVFLSQKRGSSPGSLCLSTVKNQGKKRYSTLTICQLLRKIWSILLPSQILSRRCRLTLCLSTSAILDDSLQPSDSKRKVVPQELRRTHRNRRAYRHCQSYRETEGFMRICR